jgi:hypothetical protein
MVRFAVLASDTKRGLRSAHGVSSWSSLGWLRVRVVESGAEYTTMDADRKLLRGMRRDGEQVHRSRRTRWLQAVGRM